jgi:hypothetical protein
MPVVERDTSPGLDSRIDAEPHDIPNEQAWLRHGVSQGQQILLIHGLAA